MLNKTFKPQFFGWHESLYMVNIAFSVNQSGKAFLKEYAKYYAVNDQIKDLIINHPTRGVTYFPVPYVGNHTLIIRIDEIGYTPDSMNVIAHEILHAVELTLTGVGLKLGPDSLEAWTYLNGHITQQFWEKVK